MTISLDDINEAYRKLKSYIYHENTNLLLRDQLAEFEDEAGTTNLIRYHLDRLYWEPAARLKSIPPPI